MDPAGLHARARSLAELICKAYSIEPYQLAGGASWVWLEYFNLDAATAAPASAAEQMIMLRNALAARFGLSLARESKATPMLALIVAKGGPKFRELGAEERPMAPVSPPGQVVVGVADSIRGLVLFLNFPGVRKVLGRPVVDRTGLNGRYDLWLTVSATPVSEGGRSGFHIGLKDLPNALERLGLGLKPVTAALEVYSIRSAHRPTSN